MMKGISGGKLASLLRKPQKSHFTTQCRLKLLFNGEVVSSLGEPNEPFHYERRQRYMGSSSARIYYVSSLSRNAYHCNVEARLTSGNEGVLDEYDSDDGGDESEDDDDTFDFEGDGLSCFRGLVLDRAYRPVNVVGWKRAICLEFTEKVPHLLQVVKRRNVKNLSRKNILFRDNYTCQYCSSGENLTIDHVVPAAIGGEWAWENLVTACAKCNSKKGKKSLKEAKMKLSKVPKAPKDFGILAIPLTAAAHRMLRERKGTPKEWRQYLRSS